MSFGQFQFRRDTAANWTSNNPTLLVGELGYETDTDKFKLGNGTQTWTARPYGGLKGDTGTAGTNGTNGTNGAAGRGIVSVARTSGSGAAGTTDTYTITYTDATTSTFTVVNGANGTNGTNGSNGQGVPVGGSADQYLAKINGTDYNTQWRSFVNATTTTAGFMSANDKKQIDGMYYDIVADGGADPTGVVDATSIINTAITTVAAAGGGIVYFPTGAFKVTTVNLSGNFVTLRGAGSVAAQLVTSSATADVINVTGSNCRIEDLRIIASSSSLKTAGYGINFNSGANNQMVYNVDLIFMWSGIKMTGQLIRVDQCNIRECGRNATNGAGILIDAFVDHYLSNIVQDNGVASGAATPPYNQPGHAGIRITNLSSLIMSNMQVIHCTNGLDVVPTGTNTIPSIYALNCFFDNSAIGANFVGAVGSTIARLRFIQCWFSSQSTAGVVLNNSNLNGVDFVGCEFYGNPIGIDAVAAVEWSVRASRIAGNTTAGIRTTAGANHSFTVSDNTIGSTGGFPVNGLSINVQAGTYKRYQIIDNRGFENNTTKGLTDLGVVSAADQKNVKNNMGALLGGQLNSINAPVAVPVTTETLVMSTRIPANSVAVGQVFRVKALGNAAGAAVPSWRIRAGATGTLADAQASIIASGATVANGRITIEFYITIRSATTMQIEGTATQSLTATTAGTSHGALGAPAVATIASTADWFITLSLAQTIAASTIQIAVIEAL